MASKKFEAVSIAQKKYDVSRYCNEAAPLPNEMVNYIDTKVLGDDGHIVTMSERRTVKLSDEFKNYRWTDFTIDSMIMSGALGDAKFSTLSGDRLSLADSLSSQADAADIAAINAMAQNVSVENNNVEKENE